MEVCFRFCFCFKQKTAYEMRISDWSSDVCSSDLGGALFYVTGGGAYARLDNKFTTTNAANSFDDNGKTNAWGYAVGGGAEVMVTNNIGLGRSEEHTSELQSLMRISYAVFCLKKKTNKEKTYQIQHNILV